MGLSCDDVLVQLALGRMVEKNVCEMSWKRAILRRIYPVDLDLASDSWSLTRGVVADSISIDAFGYYLNQKCSTPRDPPYVAHPERSVPLSALEYLPERQCSEPVCVRQIEWLGRGIHQIHTICTPSFQESGGLDKAMRPLPVYVEANEGKSLISFITVSIGCSPWLLLSSRSRGAQPTHCACEIYH
jgi:hypothetical protein